MTSSTPNNTTFQADDAYVAAIDSSGQVLVDSDLSDPALMPTVVAEYHWWHDQSDSHLCRGVYHDRDDVWEIFKYSEFWIVAAKGTSHYEFCEQTVAKFKHKLLAGPCPDSLKRRLEMAMVKEIQEEIDRDIIKDMCIAQGIPLPPVFKPLQAVPIVPRKLTVKWTKDEDAFKSPSVIVQSRHFNSRP